MKNRGLLSVFVLFFSIFVSSPVSGAIFYDANDPDPDDVTTRSLTNLANKLESLTVDLGGAMSFASSMGLGWSNATIGPLIDIPPHGGIGLTLGATSLKVGKLQKFSRVFFGDAASSERFKELFGEKIFLPSYVIEARIGGFRTFRFDIGLKGGYIPSVPLYKESTSYEMMIFGGDLRFRILPDWGIQPGLSLGIEVDYVGGGFSSNINNTFTSTGGDLVTGAGAKGEIRWSAWTFSAKFAMSKTFWEPPITIFAGLKGGVSLTNTVYKITGDNITFGGTPLSSMPNSDVKITKDNLQGYAGKGTFDADFNFISSSMDGISIAFNTYEGAAIRFDNRMHLQLAVMFDFINLEYGANIAFRYQQ